MAVTLLREENLRKVSTLSLDDFNVYPFSLGNNFHARRNPVTAPSSSVSP